MAIFRLLFCTCVVVVPMPLAWPQNNDSGGNSLFKDLVSKDAPDAYWSFDGDTLLDPKGLDADQQTIGKLPKQSGATSPEFPVFGKQNSAIKLDGKSYLRIKDPGEGSVFDFEKGDPVSIEAWVAPKSLPGSYSYIVGKGRTFLPGMVKENHNWSLRLKKQSGGAAISFLFRSNGKGNEYHRWESKETLSVGDGWHHVAVTYTFGKKGSIRGYIDGKEVGGKWDLGGDTARAPNVNDDEVWIGSAMGGSKGSSFVGGIDEVALYRKVLSPERIGQRYSYNTPDVPDVDVPDGEVLIQIFEGIPNQNAFSFRSMKHAETFTQNVFAFPTLPKRYNERGVHVSRPTPFLIRASANVVIPKGKKRLLFRSREGSRLFLDGDLVGATNFYDITAEANGAIWDLDRSQAPNIRSLQRGDRQEIVEIDGDGKTHELRYESLVALRGRRAELGDACVAIADPDGDFQVIGFDKSFHLTESGWDEFAEWDRKRLQLVNRQRRMTASETEQNYWDQRHQFGLEYVLKAGHNPNITIDDLVQKSSTRNTKRAIGDLAFLRRVSLDIIGTIPSRELVAKFMADTSPDRRAKVIDTLLADEGWADHWVGYWQDVLAENPNVVNPTLNNTGPFRWWIHESFLSNKPMDRFVTELIRMEGAALEGGPAGFELATANDVPMAAKSHLISQAFLGIQMKCARCHDSPSHETVQKDLFSIAAMLKRGPEQVPKTSSIDLPPEELENMAVKVTLKPGSKVNPAWPFKELMGDSLPDWIVRNKRDTREELAAVITLPANRRFARVMVNRVWTRYLGFGLVDSVDDWEFAESINDDLLSWLANEFVKSGYDFKHIARLIFNSRFYQLPAVERSSAAEFAGPAQRSLTAEQLVDSMFVVSEKSYNAGLMAFDIDGARPAKVSLNLGRPRRAWMFTATSNERDRPGLALPFAEPFVTFLQQFGWRGARQNPITDRPDDLTALQPAEFLNGVLARRTQRLSDDNALTALAMNADLTLDELVDEVYLRMLVRFPSSEERELVAKFLTAGYESRLRPNQPTTQPKRDRRGTISWSNHLEEEATTIKQELEQVVRRGDPPTRRLDSDWRERMEDVVWSLMNSPEFRFSP